jgi:hypothetical protein
MFYHSFYDSTIDCKVKADGTETRAVLGPWVPRLAGENTQRTRLSRMYHLGGTEELGSDLSTLQVDKYGNYQ